MYRYTALLPFLICIGEAMALQVHFESIAPHRYLVDELLRLDLEKIRQERSEGKIWVVAHIRPAPSSGVAQMAPMTFSRETGKVKLPEDKKLYKSYSGWYTVIHVLGHKAPANADGTFGWTIVVEETLVGDGQRPPLRTWPFERQPSSMIMCKLNEAEKGMEQFAEAVLLPEYWDRFAPEAVQPGDDYVARIESLKQKPSVPEISGFLTQKNPLLAIEAAKKLVQIPEGRACLIDSAANGASGYRQAIFMELAIRNALEKEDEDACAEIKKIYESKESSYHVWGLALAAHRLLFKRARFSGGNTKAFARELLKSMRMDNFPASEVGERQYEELHEMLSAVRNEDNEEIKPEGDPEE